jgi:hypothetical protein
MIFSDRLNSLKDKEEEQVVCITVRKEDNYGDWNNGVVVVTTPRLALGTVTCVTMPPPR